MSKLDNLLSNPPGVLLVDDEPNILLSLEFLMRKNGYAVFVARDGTEALDIARQEKPAVVILDIMMPGLDGYEVCRLIKSEPELQHAHVIFLSARGREEDIRKGLALGASLYLTKPFSTRVLMEKVQEMVGAEYVLENGKWKMRSEKTD